MRNLLLLLVLLASPVWADVKISDLPAGAAITGVEPTPVVQAGVTVQTTPADIGTYIKGTLTSADVLGLFTGTCDLTTFVRGDGACAVVTVPSAANPTGSVGLTAVNGSASTYMRSDGSPALDQSIVPTWTGVHTWSLAEPRWVLNETGLGADLGRWDLDLDAGIACLRTRTDADAAGVNAWCVTRGSTTALSNISLGNATSNQTGNWLGTGLFTFGGNIQLGSSEPRMKMAENDQASDEKIFDIDLQSKVFRVRTRTDADGAGVDAIAITRGTGTAISDISFGNATSNNTFNFLGTGVTNFAGSISLTGGTTGVTAGRYTVNGTIVPANGIYRVGTNRLSFATNTTYRGEFDASGQFIIGTVGAGLSVKEGTNAKMGTVTLSAGTATVSTTAVTANSRIFLTAQSLGTVTVPQGLAPSSRTAGTSFTVSSADPTDTSVVAWFIVEPSP